jgi:asparagine synthase (glutamine-hydrolysing)
VRPPLLDHELFELAARVPSRFKVRDGQTKWILKEAFRDRLPPGTIARPKRGFEVPMDDWLRGPLADMFEGAVLAPQGRLSHLVNRATVHKLYREHRQGIGRQGQTLWALLVLARWADRYLRSTDHSSLAQPQPVALSRA